MRKGYDCQSLRFQSKRGGEVTLDPLCFGCQILSAVHLGISDRRWQTRLQSVLHPDKSELPSKLQYIISTTLFSFHLPHFIWLDFYAKQVS